MEYLFIGGKQDGCFYNVADNLKYLEMDASPDINEASFPMSENTSSRTELYRKHTFQADHRRDFILYARDDLSSTQIMELLINNYKPSDKK